MDELDDLPKILDATEFIIPASTTSVQPVSTPTITKKRKKPTTSKSKKADLVKRYLQNLDSTKEAPPTDAELKSFSVAKLETLCTIQEKQSTHKLQPSGLAESLIGFVSQCLDFVAQTDNEICRLNSEDTELLRCVSEELGSIATYLNNKIKIASHVCLNSGRAIVKKRKLEKENGYGTEVEVESSITRST
jgi:hypothetical protein